MAGNSLGLLPKEAKVLINEELDVWGSRSVRDHSLFSSAPPSSPRLQLLIVFPSSFNLFSAVLGHFNHPHSRPWKDIDDTVVPALATIVGASSASEVACTSTLTSNLHNLFVTFFRPEGKKTKILCEGKAFPSDQVSPLAPRRKRNDRRTPALTFFFVVCRSISPEFAWTWPRVAHRAEPEGGRGDSADRGYPEGHRGAGGGGESRRVTFLVSFPSTLISGFSRHRSRSSGSRESSTTAARSLIWRRSPKLGTRRSAVSQSSSLVSLTRSRLPSPLFYRAASLGSISLMPSGTSRSSCTTGASVRHPLLPSSFFYPLTHPQSCLADFAVWCHYKYLNSGPGAVAGLFVHDVWADQSSRPRFVGVPLPPSFPLPRLTHLVFLCFIDIRLAGWWGHSRFTRFAMPPSFSPIPGAQGYQHSNPPLLSLIPLIATLSTVEIAGGPASLRKRSVLLTNYLLALLKSSGHYRSKGGEGGFGIITSSGEGQSEEKARGAQLSLTFVGKGAERGGRERMKRVHESLVRRGVMGDEREPEVVRFA